MTISPRDQIFELEDNVTLNCTSFGGPNNTFAWRNSSAFIIGEVFPTLDLIPVVGGVYTCEVSNAAGTGQDSTDVFVQLRFNTNPSPILTDTNNSRVFVCEAEAFPRPTYEWFRSDGDVRSDLTGINTSMLVFESVEFSDFGRYFCLATSGNRSMSSEQATLTGKERVC